MTSLSWYVPDSHCIAWHFVRDGRLTERASQLMRGAELGLNGLIVPTIVMAELQLLYERRLPNLPLEQIIRRLDELPEVLIVPFDMEIYGAFRQLPGDIDIHDRIIAATAIHFGVPLVTRDRRLQQLPGGIWN